MRTLEKKPLALANLQHTGWDCSSKTFITLRYLSVHAGFKIFIATSTFFPFAGFHKLRYTRDIPPWPSFF